ncbi:MAG: type I-E CRISPR-associated protein Cse1/CasA [Pseudomonadota bacterium]
MSRFNLIDKPWIPVRFPDGTRAELGIRDTLLRAKDIAVIEDSSPLVVASLHRLLLAVLYRALEGPTDIDQAKALFKAGLPADKIEAYLEQWRPRFWLFDDTYRILQIPGYDAPKKWQAWTKLAAERNSNDTRVLFDHTNVTAAGSISEATAARWLIAIQTFALGGGNSDFGYTSTAPSAGAAMVIPVGHNLADTLLFCLTPQNREVLRSDLPAWECEPDTPTRLLSGIARSISGNAQLYTWLSRSIHLKQSANTELTHVAFAAGIKFDGEFFDPMLAYRIDEKHGRLPIHFKEHGLWRDFDSLLPDDAHLAPAVIEHAADLTRLIRERAPKSVMVLGQSSNKAKIEYWRMERYQLPPSLVSNANTRSEIRQLLIDAELSESALDASLRDWAKSMITKCDRDLQPDKWANGKWIPGDVSKAIGKTSLDMPPAPALVYWSTLEAAFHEVLRQYTLDADPDAIRYGWLKTVRSTLRDAWQRHVASVSTSNAWATRALMRAEEHVNNQAGMLSKEIQQYETYLKSQRQSQEESA